MNSRIYNDEMRNAVTILRNARYDARSGLPEELFLLVSSLVPIPNVDLLITDDEGRLLLSRRNDRFFGKGWHIPGGCIRFGETMEHRIQETALAELGCTVTFDEKPVAIRDVILEPRTDIEFPNERIHHIATLYRCKLPDGYIIKNNNLTEDDQGYLKWFSTLPEDMLKVHDVYKDILEPWIRRKK